MLAHNLDILARYSDQLPHLAGRFEEVLAMQPEKRLLWAKEERSSIYRDGWFVNTPVGEAGDGETVAQHASHLLRLIEKYFPEDQKEEASFLAEFHDDHEALAHTIIDGKRRDLNPEFNPAQRIAKEDKKIIESLAREVLFESRPDIRQRLDSYPESLQAGARNFRDLDKLCVMWKCLEYVESGKYGYRDFYRYWEYWNLGNVRSKCARVVSDAFERDVLPAILRLEL